MAAAATVFLILLLVIVAFKASAGEKRTERERTARINATYSDLNVRAEILQKKIWQGMPADQLVDSWGKPNTVTRQVLKTKVKETFRYGSNRYGSSVYLENGRVTGWRQSN